MFTIEDEKRLKELISKALNNYMQTNIERIVSSELDVSEELEYWKLTKKSGRKSELYCDTKVANISFLEYFTNTAVV